MELMAAFRGGVISFDVASRMHGGHSLSTSPEIPTRNLSLSTFARAVCLTYPIPRISYEYFTARDVPYDAFYGYDGFALRNGSHGSNWLRK